MPPTSRASAVLGGQSDRAVRNGSGRRRRGRLSDCADLGARTIREEIDALRVMGVEPVRALLVPRVLAATLVSCLVKSLVTLTVIVGASFSRCSSNTSPRVRLSRG